MSVWWCCDEVWLSTRDTLMAIAIQSAYIAPTLPPRDWPRKERVDALDSIWQECIKVVKGWPVSKMLSWHRLNLKWLVISACVLYSIYWLQMNGLICFKRQAFLTSLNWHFSQGNFTSLWRALMCFIKLLLSEAFLSLLLCIHIECMDTGYPGEFSYNDSSNWFLWLTYNHKGCKGNYNLHVQ